ncbi:MAG: hypothetical protein KME10_26860 [Plectolyngbya sp. WJT66-NPBG17]|nr:hypothetical protein [Plectolyngbya sp. WJT66-NPBG17]
MNVYGRYFIIVQNCPMNGCILLKYLEYWYHGVAICACKTSPFWLMAEISDSASG